LRSNPVFSLDVDEVRLECLGERFNDLAPAVATPYGIGLMLTILNKFADMTQDNHYHHYHHGAIG
jgi:hypothetical protein